MTQSEETGRVDPADAVRAIVQARRSGTAARAADVPLRDAAAAYAVQDGVARAFGWFADPGPSHWKSGGASRDAPLTHARLPPAGVWAHGADRRAWPFALRGIEAEVALRLKRDVDAATATGIDFRAEDLIDAICVSIEIVDSRWVEGLDAPPLARLADLQSHGALVLGAWTAFAARDWASQACRVTVGRQPSVERRGTHALGDPAFVLAAWLRHATRGGARLMAGSVVTTGTWCGVLQAAAGDLVSADFPGIGHASVQL